MNIDKYKTLIFDCDGVILNSNNIKTQAFYDVAKVYGREPAEKLKDYHVKNNGINRYLKFEYFLKCILKKEIDQVELKKLLNNFSLEVKKALLNCEVAEGLDELRRQTKHIKWMIVSGGDQQELRELFESKGLNKLFDGGIFGSPDIKELILERELESSNINFPVLFLGDSLYDYQCAQNEKLDFIFLSGWSAVKDYKQWCNDNSIKYIKYLKELLI